MVLIIISEFLDTKNSDFLHKVCNKLLPVPLLVLDDNNKALGQLSFPKVVISPMENIW